MTWTEVLATTDPMRDVVVRDANTVFVATQMGGSFVSTNGGVSFNADGRARRSSSASASRPTAR